MAPGLIAPRAELEAEGYGVFTLGADVLGLGEYFRAKLAAFEQAAALKTPKAKRAG